MSPNRKTLETLGRKGKADYVRIVREPVDGASKIRVLWKEPDRRAETFEDTRNGLREARAFAEAKSDALRAPPPAAPIARIALRDLHQRYVLAKESEWAPNTVRLSHERWRDFELFAGRATFADSINRGHLDELKKALLAAGRSPNQVKHVLKEVVREFTWAVEWDVIQPTKLTNFTVKFTKEVRRSAPVMAEYSLEERERLLAAMDPRDSREWRAWVLTTLLGYAGPRVTAALHLTVDDVELYEPAWDPATGGYEFSGRVHWRAETSKTDQDWWQPVPPSVAEALWVAIGWRQAMRYTGKFLFPAVSRARRGERRTFKPWELDPKNKRVGAAQRPVAVEEQPYTYAAYNGALHRFERRAGIPTIKYRAAHGHRRGVGGDIHAATGSLRAAADFLGDKSTKVVSDHYVLVRQEELQRSATAIEQKRNEVLRRRKEGPGTSPEPSESNINGEPAVGIEPTTARSQGDS